MTTDLIIIGAGASGLMAACTAGEARLHCMLVERRHRPGLKLRMCGNNRCNISHASTAEEMKHTYGNEIGNFMSAAIQNFTPDMLRTWFRGRNLATTVLKKRIYPRSEKADDVLHTFTDSIRDLNVPLLFNCTVDKIFYENDQFTVDCGTVKLESKYVLLATGGLSYPKTGSVGDGQRIAAALGHHLEECRPGLAGVFITQPFNGIPLAPGKKPTNFPETKIKILANNSVLGVTEGNLLADSSELRGSAIFDAVRIVARANVANFTFCISGVGDQKNNNEVELQLTKDSICPIKEAILTMGGVKRNEINPLTMESLIIPGLYFAGELIDIDGPTGGYNLHAAFATARLAVKSICQALHSGDTPRVTSSRSFQTRRSPATKERGRSKTSYTGAKGQKNTWGKDFWDGHLSGSKGKSSDRKSFNNK